jgi:hypothetical protein
MTDLEAKMRPGAKSQKGFLGPRESLDSILREDRATLARLGLSYDAIADALEKVLLLAMDRYWEHEEGFAVGNLLIRLDVFRGFQDCPWECQQSVCGALGHIEFAVTDTRTRESIAGPGLIIHLIRDHQFFEGKESPYRVDPEKLARVLGLIDGD